MRKTRLPALLTLACFASWGIAQANWTATGTFVYIDRVYDETGFTGAEPALPVRFANVEVRDFNLSGNKGLLATGATDGNGNFSIAVTDSKTRSVYVRVVSNSTSTPGLFLKVQNRLTPKNPYAVASPPVPNHAPSVNVSFSTVTAAIGSGGDAFNIYDIGLRAIDFIAALAGSRPGSGDLLTIEWEPNFGASGSNYNYSNKTINLGDPSSYNDTVIAHESGHYAYHLYSATDSPGGIHHLTDCHQDLRLAFEEGRATFFGQSVRRYHNLSRPDLYVKTTGGPGPGNLDFYFNVETEEPFYCDGAASEVAVYSAQWDINDSASTADLSPGVDDDTLSRPDADTWDVDKNYIPTAVNKSLEDFWNGWFARGKGFKNEMIAAFQRTNVEYYTDASEPNDSAASAQPVSTSGAIRHLTYFADVDSNGVGEADTDYFSFSAIAGTSYTIETLNLWGKANTSLELRASDGVTALASNDDRAAGDDSSLINYTPSSSGTLYIRSIHAADLGIHGSYDLRVSGGLPVDSDLDGYTNDVDCNDNNASIHPGATEVCNGVDDNCAGGIDEGFDQDADGYTTCGGDCNDGNAAVNPGHAEVCNNGIDDNCNNLTDSADPVCQTDTVIITKAEWKSQGKRLTVWATSSGAPGAVLTLVGYGTMSYDSANSRYTFTQTNTPNPGTVTVTSSQGGSDTKPVTPI